MAEKDSSAEDFNPRHRILGAVILVALAVMLVPVLLKNHEPPQELKGEVPTPPADATQPPNRVVVSPVTTPGAHVKPAPPIVEPTAAKSESAAATKTVTTKVEPPPAPVKETSSATPKPAAAPMPEKGWVVQVGTFAEKDNATRLSSKLTQHGHHVLREDISLEGRSAIRLRVGPFADKGAALKAQARIEREVAVKGVVLAYP